MTFYVFLSCCTRFPEQCRTPILTLTLTQRDPDYHYNLLVSCVSHVPPFT